MSKYSLIKPKRNRPLIKHSINSVQSNTITLDVNAYLELNNTIAFKHFK